jgi:hypothetical protein
MPDGLAHAPDLTVSTLVDRDPQHAGMGLGDAGGMGDAVIELDPFAKRPDRSRWNA